MQVREVSSVWAPALAAEPVHAQSFPTATIGLKFDVGARTTAAVSGELPWGPAGSVVSVTSTSLPQAVRLEVRYTLSGSAPNDGWDMVGLGVAGFDIRSSIAPTTGTSFQLAPRADGTHGSGLGVLRYVIERTRASFSRFRRLRLCYERWGTHFQALHDLAAAMLVCSRLKSKQRPF